MASKQPRSAIPWIALTAAAVFAIFAAIGVMMTAPPGQDADTQFAFKAPREAPRLPAVPPTLPDVPVSPS